MGKVLSKRARIHTDLTRNPTIHTGEAPCKYDVCGKGFVQADNHTRHARM